MNAVADPGVIASVRLRHLRPGDELFAALVDGGVGAVEVTLPTPGSEVAIARWRALGGALVGAGTVRTADDVDRAAAVGAQFLVTPTTSPNVLAAAARHGLPIACGAMTPTEIDNAVGLGATWVKVFPVDALGGPAYVSAVAQPLHDVRFVPTGGVTAQNAGAYAALGCAGVGVGSSLVDEASVAAHDWPGIRAHAEALVAAWKSGRAGRG